MDAYSEAENRYEEEQQLDEKGCLHGEPSRDEEYESDTQGHDGDITVWIHLFPRYA